jgi:hypothetical protein
MRARVLLWLSLGLNILLAIMIVLLSQDFLQGDTGANGHVRTQGSSKHFKTNVVVRRQGFTWSEVESADFPTYIANLRRIRCPEKTIRDIIVAEVNDLYAERMAREITLPEQKWWLSDPEMDAFEAGMDQIRALDAEKNQLLAQLLGSGWDAQRTTANASVVRFDGPVLSKLATETKASVERIEANSSRLRTELEERARQEGRGLDGAELARLRQETRRELAAILNPQELEEYLLRYSHGADQMREQLRGFGADADEFRRIFRARDTFDQQIAALTGNDAATAQRRASLERLRDDAVRQAIGPERFGLYQAAQNPLFRAAQEQAEQSGAAPDKVLPIFRINQAVQDEITRIQADRTISEDQRRIALATIQQQQRNSIDRILSNQPPEELAAAQPQQAAQITPAEQQARAAQIILPPLPEPFAPAARSRGPGSPIQPRRR